MAGDWITMRIDLPDDPAVIAISDSTGLDSFSVVGRLHRLWAWASAHTADGRAQVSAKHVDRLVSHEGFAVAMSAVGWLVVADNHITFPRFDKHNSKSAKRRAADAERKRRVRKLSAKCPQAADKNSVREEKRREENNKETASAVSGGKPARFVPPTVDEVRAHCVERGNGIDAEHFVNTYQRQGWKLSNGQAMRDWKATIVTWEKNNKQRAGPKPAAVVGNQTVADKVKEQINAAKSRLANGPPRGLPGLDVQADECRRHDPVAESL